VALGFCELRMVVRCKYENVEVKSVYLITAKVGGGHAGFLSFRNAFCGWREGKLIVCAFCETELCRF